MNAERDNERPECPMVLKCLRNLPTCADCIAWSIESSVEILGTIYPCDEEYVEGEFGWEEKEFPENAKRYLLVSISKAIKQAEQAAFEEGQRDGIERAAKVISGEAEIYEERVPLATKSRIKKMQGRWAKLKNLEKRIRALPLTPRGGEK